jgi:hypothetical protein
VTDFSSILVTIAWSFIMPLLANFIAFESRLINIWRMRVGSPYSCLPTDGSA